MTSAAVDKTKFNDPEKVPRFDIHQRIQHGMMMASFITLGMTGWPLKMAETGAAAGAIAKMLGGIAACQLIHRGAALVMIACSAYHLAYLLIQAYRKNIDYQMVPSPHDVVCVFQNVFYMAGLRKEVPEFGRFTYFEKFDYWAVFWGMVMMGGTGLILWFPVQASWLLPGWMIQISHIIHSDEALLALLVIFVWHMYNVHLRPGVWPMSNVWIDGTMDGEEMRRYHMSEYRRLFPEHAAKHDEKAK